jgi:hypothetical protein
VQLQGLPTSVAPIESEPASANDRGANEQLEMRSQREDGEQVDKPLISPLPAAADLAVGASNIRFEHMLALVAAVLALAAGMVRQVFKLFVVRRLRRRRSALRREWEAASATRAPVSSAFADMVPVVRHVVHDPVAATRFADIARRPASHRNPSHDIAEYGLTFGDRRRVNS